MITIIYPQQHGEYGSCNAVKNYQYGKGKVRTDRIVQLSLALSGFSEQDRPGEKMLLMMMESVRSELAFAQKSTGHSMFTKAINFLSEPFP